MGAAVWWIPIRTPRTLCGKPQKERKTMNNSQVAHLWASQSKPSAKGSNFYFDGGTIYSYGPHFPIARIVSDRGPVHVLFTTRGYSTTTAKHINLARRAVSHLPVFNVPDPTNQGLLRERERVENYLIRIREAFDIAKRARTATWKHEHAVSLVNECRAYCKQYGLPDPFEGTEVAELAERAKESIARIQSERQAEIARREAEEIAEAKKDLVEFLEMGLAKAPTARMTLIPPVLRVIVRETGVLTVQTSHGAEVEYNHAKRSFDFIKAVWDRGQEWKRNGATHHVGPFSLESITADKVVIGCHSFERSEIERFAAQEGWV